MTRLVLGRGLAELLPTGGGAADALLRAQPVYDIDPSMMEEVVKAPRPRAPRQPPPTPDAALLPSRSECVRRFGRPLRFPWMMRDGRSS